MAYRHCFVFLALFCWSLGGAWAQAPRDAAQSFTVVAFHDVVDRSEELDSDAVTTDRLVAFFDHLRGDGWSPVSLQDLSDARRGVKPLPSKPILITFDDGYSSLYSRVFPLLLAYRIPVVAALVGKWMEHPQGSVVPYGVGTKPREHFIDWAQAREMQASGLVEFASHSYNQHRELQSNPQGNLTPALAALAFDPAKDRYETPDQYRQRLFDDLLTNETVMQRELGKKPRAMVWPYGRYNQTAMGVLKQAGYEFAFTLDDEPGHLQRPLSIGRYWPTGNLRVADLVNDLRFMEVLPRARRMVRIDPGQWWTGHSDAFETRLASAIDRLRANAITDVVIEGLHKDKGGGRWSAWFPTRSLPLRADLLSRIVWQLRTRAGVRTSVDLSFQAIASQLQEAELKQLHQDLGRHVMTDGLMMRMVPMSTKTESIAPDITTRWESVQSAARKSTFAGDLRATRYQILSQDLNHDERLALEAFRAVEGFRPSLNWLVHTAWNDPSPVSQWADLVLIDAKPLASDVQASSRTLWEILRVKDPLTRRRTGLWIDAPKALSAEHQKKLLLELQAAGVAVLGGQFLGD